MTDTGPVAVEAGEWSTEKLIATLEEGRRIVVTTQFMGESRDVTMRWDGDTYYCDSPMRLHKHSSRSEMADCLRRLGYAADAAADGQGADGRDA